MTLYALWAVLLVIQNASFTLVSRARNSGSIKFHAIASVFSNGIWFASQTIIISIIANAFAKGDVPVIVMTGLFYTVFTVIGSITMHHISMKYIEAGKRAVGARG